MLHYRGPRLRYLPGPTCKMPTVKNEFRNQSFFSKKSQYLIRLEEKQKLCFHNGLTERQLLKYVRFSRKAKDQLVKLGFSALGFRV